MKRKKTNKEKRNRNHGNQWKKKEPFPTVDHLISILKKFSLILASIIILILTNRIKMQDKI